MEKILFGIFCISTGFALETLHLPPKDSIEEYLQYFDIASVPIDKTVTKGHGKYVVCIWNSWAFWRPAEGKHDILDGRHFDGNLCTHIVYRSTLLNNETFHLQIKDPTVDLQLGYLRKVPELKSKFPHLKVLLSVGGWNEGTKTFPFLAAEKKNRKTFTRNATDTIKQYGFDGLNLDWEFPGMGTHSFANQDKKHFTALAQTLKKEFNKTELILTTTISGDRKIVTQGYEISKIGSIFDLIFVMAYDYRGPWDTISGHNAPLYAFSGVSDILKLILEAEVNPEVLVLGIPLFGRPYVLKNPSSFGLENHAESEGFFGPLNIQQDMMTYSEICEILQRNLGSTPWKTFWDRGEMVPFSTNGSHWISFDNPDSIFAKVWLAKKLNLAGIMAFTIDTDDFTGRYSKVTNPLLRTINYALQMNIQDPEQPTWLPLCTLYNSTSRGNAKVFMEQMKPKILENISVIAKGSDHLKRKVKCYALGNPRPNFRWFKLEEIKVVKEVEFFNKQVEFNPIEPVGSNSSSFPIYLYNTAYMDCGPHKPLEVSEENELIKDNGHYLCMAKNIFGEYKRNFSLLSTTATEPETDETDEGTGTVDSNVPWGWIVGSFIIIVNICLIAYYLRQKSNKKEGGLSKKELKVFFRGSSGKGPRGENVYQNEGQSVCDNVPYNTSYEIFQRNFKIEESHILGNGEFGIVFLGYVNESPVAVKSPKQDTENKQYILALLSELKILIYLETHQNIVNLVGASTVNLSKGVLHVFVEYCPLGNLQQYLRNSCRGYLISLIQDDEWNQKLIPSPLEEKMITSKNLLSWSHQIAKAMEYLAFKKVIHGDLASRNVLLFQKDLIKVTDFGLSRKLYEYTNYVKNKQEPLPWRWMAIESLRDLEFSHQSDVWSFGITIWEIFSLGETPYSGLSWSVDFVDRLRDGLRVHKPKYSTTEFYNYIASCWQDNPQDRPKPEELTIYFYELLKTKFSSDYTYFVDPQEMDEVDLN